MIIDTKDLSKKLYNDLIKTLFKNKDYNRTFQMLKDGYEYCDIYDKTYRELASIAIKTGNTTGLNLLLDKYFDQIQGKAAVSNHLLYNYLISALEIIIYNKWVSYLNEDIYIRSICILLEPEKFKKYHISQQEKLLSLIDDNINYFKTISDTDLQGIYNSMVKLQRCIKVSDINND